MNILFCHYGVDTVYKSSVRIQLSQVYSLLANMMIMIDSFNFAMLWAEVKGCWISKREWPMSKSDMELIRRNSGIKIYG